MKKIMILHRSDLFNLTSDLPIEMISVEHFKIPLKDYEGAEFIAFEEFGLLKILKNIRGRLATIPYVSFMMAINMATTPSTLLNEVNGEHFKPDGDPTATLPPDYKDITPGSIMVSLDGDYNHISEGEISLVDKRTGEPIIPPLKYRLTPDQISLYNGRPKEFYKELMKTSEYYGHHLLQDYNDEMNSSVATAIEMGRPVTPQFPETLSEAIVYFDHNFHDIPVLAFQHTEIHFTTTFKMKYPEVYTNIKKSCGFWCEDSPLYKNLSATYKCNHEACLLNIILKGIYRYRNAGRDRSGDFTDVINSYKP